MVFADRRDAGMRLAERLVHLRGEDPVVVALPRGGVVVGYEVAAALGAPLDVMVVRKIGAPTQPELAIGAVTELGEPIVLLDERMIERLGVSEQYLKETVAQELDEVRRRRDAYAQGRPAPSLAGRTAIVVDDGVATGATARTALRAVRQLRPASLVLALPVAPPETLEAMRDEVDEVVCLSTPSPFYSVGMHYERFDQTTDREVVELLARAREPAGGRAP